MPSTTRARWPTGINDSRSWGRSSICDRSASTTRAAAWSAAGARGAAAPAFGSCAGQPGLGAFADQGALELSGGAQDLEGELALRGGRVDRVHERAEEGAFRLQPLDHFQQMRKRPRQTVDAHHHQRVALGDPLEHAGQHGPRAVSARSLLFMDICAARGFQGLRLGQGGLILGRYAGIAVA